MKKICLCCKRPTSHLSFPLELTEEQILCRDCVGDSVIYDFNKIHPQMPEEAFSQLKNKIISSCQGTLPQDALDCLITAMDLKHSSSHNTINTIANHTTEAKEALSSNATGMFSNIGEKIKKLATISTWIGFIASFILGISLTFLFDEELFFIGFIVMALGFLFSWTSSFILYGFGQLITNSDKLVQMSKEK